MGSVVAEWLRQQRHAVVVYDNLVRGHRDAVHRPDGCGGDEANDPGVGLGEGASGLTLSAPARRRRRRPARCSPRPGAVTVAPRRGARCR